MIKFAQIIHTRLKSNWLFIVRIGAIFWVCGASTAQLFALEVEKTDSPKNSLSFGLSVLAGGYSGISLPRGTDQDSLIDGTIPSKKTEKIHKGVGLNFSVRHLSDLPKFSLLESDFRTSLVAPMIGSAVPQSNGYRTIELASKLKSSPMHLWKTEVSGSTGLKFSRYGYTLFSFGHYIDSFGIPLTVYAESLRSDWSFEASYFYGLQNSLSYSSLMGTKSEELRAINLFSQALSLSASYVAYQNVKWHLGFDYHQAYVGIPTTAYFTFGLVNEPYEDTVRVFDLHTALLSIGFTKSF